jgi:O-antigen/teichoic acid export membrane protein
MIKKLLGQLGNKHFLSLAGNIIMSVLAMVTVAIMCRYIYKGSDHSADSSLAAFGTWVFFQGTLLLIDTFRSGFLTTAFIKFYAGATPQRAQEVVGSTWYIAAIITGIISLLNIPALFFLNNITDEGLYLFVQWFGVSFWIMLPFFISTCIAQGDQRFDRLLYLRLMNQGSFLVAVIVLSLFDKLSVHSVLYSFLGSYAFPGIIVLFNGWAKAGAIKFKTKATSLELYHFGKFSVGTTLSSNMFRHSDTLIINFMLGQKALGVYNVGLRLMELVEIPLRSFAATGMPELSAAYNRNDKLGVINIMKKYTGMLTVLLIPAGVIAVVLADVAIGIIGGGQYVNTEAANVFRLFMTFAILYPADRFMALTIDVIHQPKINFIKVLVMLAANVIFDFLGIGIFGNVYGVALSSLIPTLIGVGVGYWALNRYMKFSFGSILSTGYKACKELVQTGLRQFKKGA